MKPLTFFAAIAFIFTSCASSHDPAAQKILTGYKNFVDSIYAQNEEWKVKTDTIFVETPIDTDDPGKIRIDTIIKSFESKTTIIQDDFFGKQILEAYEPLKTEMETVIPKMNESMKKEYEISRQKFESMMAK